MVSFIVYSHSEYDDCWIPFFDRLKRHCGHEFDNYYLLSDATNEKMDARFEHIPYNNDEAYTDRVLSCLKQIDTSHCLFQHEDMMLYDDIHEGYFQHCLDWLQGGGPFPIDSIKLHKSGSPHDNHPANEWPINGSDVLKMTLINHDMMFSIQPTLWNTEKLIDILENNQGLNGWEFETQGQGYCKEILLSACYVQHESDQQRGMLHWDSMVWPYIATAVFKGKWCTNEYPKELREMFEEYSIDYRIRGTL